MSMTYSCAACQCSAPQRLAEGGACCLLWLIDGASWLMQQMLTCFQHKGLVTCLGALAGTPASELGLVHAQLLHRHAVLLAGVH